MSNDSNIYTGTVTEVAGPYATVALDDAPKCGGCAIASACGSRPSDRLVTARRHETVAMGDRVKVKCPPSASSRAMMWGIVVPCLLLIATTMVLQLTPLNDSTIAGTSLGVVAVYYLLLAVFRNRLNRKLEWTILP